MQYRVPQKTLFVSDTPYLLIFGEAGGDMKIYQFLSILKRSLGLPSAIFQDGRQNRVKNGFLSLEVLLLSGTWLIICPFLGFRGQGIQICQNGLLQKIQDGGNPRWPPKWRPKCIFLP